MGELRTWKHTLNPVDLATSVPHGSSFLCVFTPAGCITVCGSCQSYAMPPPSNQGPLGSDWIVSLQIPERMM
jgi:hypothetical protein